MSRVLFFCPPTVQMLDFAGPLQAFYEAQQLGAEYELTVIGFGAATNSAQPVQLSHLQPYFDVLAQSNDLIILAGLDASFLEPAKMMEFDPGFFQWLRRSYAAGAKICSVCNATFLLAFSGLLDGKQCTTHWKRVDELKSFYPQIKVLKNRLFVQDERLYSSAGICSGIDMAIAIIEEDLGPIMASKVAKEMVVYIRRDGFHSQKSIFLDYRTHLNPTIHLVQDQLVAHPEITKTIAEIAQEVGMSERHLTRLFRQETGVSIGHYREQIRMEHAHTLLKSNLSLEQIACECGFKDARQLRRLWQKWFGESPSSSRKVK